MSAVWNSPPSTGSPGPDGWGGKSRTFRRCGLEGQCVARSAERSEFIWLHDFTHRWQHPYPIPWDYKQVVKQVVADATALGMYVILDLHKNAPKGTINGALMQIAPQSSTQNQMADADNSAGVLDCGRGDFRISERHFSTCSMSRTSTTWSPRRGYRIQCAWTILRDGGTKHSVYGDNTTFQATLDLAGNAGDAERRARRQVRPPSS